MSLNILYSRIYVVTVIISMCLCAIANLKATVGVLGQMQESAAEQRTIG